AGPISFSRKNIAKAQPTPQITGRAWLNLGRLIHLTFSRRSRSHSHFFEKYPARKSANRILMASTGWKGPRLTVESIPRGPEPKFISNPNRTKLRIRGV